MASYDLYEASPLFGDLMGLTPDVEVGVYGGLDGAPGKTGLAQVIQGHEESSNLHNGLLGPLDFGWMDSNVDLLQFLTGEEVAPLEPTPPAIVKSCSVVMVDTVESIITEADSAIAVEILKSVAEDTTKMLDSGSDPAIKESSSQDIAGEDWFDILDDEVSQALAGHVVTDALSPVLSPVTAEDVESILSSGSSSPSQEMDTSGDWLSVMAMENIEIDSNTESSVQSSVFDEVSQSDLECLLARVGQVKSFPDDHNYQSVVSPAPSDSSSRPKPYSRSKNTSRSSSKAPNEPKLDRHERKKQQNKDAALRYRLKKKQEAGIVCSEVDELETRNTQLKDTVEQMTREIKYLKNLLSDVYKAKGFVKSQ